MVIVIMTYYLDIAHTLCSFVYHHMMMDDDDDNNTKDCIVMCTIFGHLWMIVSAYKSHGQSRELFNIIYVFRSASQYCEID